MKKVLASIALMMAFANLAFAQASTPQKAVNTLNNNQSGGQNVTAGLSNAPQKAGNRIQAPTQQGNATAITQPNKPAQSSSDNQGRKVCRVVGTTAYYCL